MSILTDLTPATLTAAIEENLFSLLRAMGRLPGGRLEESEDMIRFSTGLPSPMFNGVARTRVETVSPNLLDRPYFWWTGPQSAPADLDDRLAAAGLREAGRNWPGMAMALADIDEEQAAPEGVVIESARSEPELERWGRIFWAAHDLPPWSADSWQEAARRLRFRDLPWDHWVATIDGEPAGVGISHTGGGAVGLYGIGTLPAARRRGIGSALTLVPMLAARDEGFHAAILHATPDGERLYLHLGFREYCRISRFAGGL
ncbi:MAG: GNAT family N-acetyltransferase [Gaiellaceae bacterium]